jgi:competence protein ComGC
MRGGSPFLMRGRCMGRGLKGLRVWSMERGNWMFSLQCLCLPAPVKLFYTGPVINTEMLVVMLEKHGIAATQAFADPTAPEDGDWSRPARVRFPEIRAQNWWHEPCSHVKIRMKTRAPNRHWAFTVVEALVVTLVVVILLAMFLLTLARPQRRSSRIGCVNYLKQIGVAMRIWEGDNNDKYPMNVPVSRGGALELMATGNVVACFQVMSNELATPKILACPADAQHTCATNFGGSLTTANLSYFLALDAADTDPQIVLSGDDNLVQNGRPSSSGIVNFSSSPATWTKDRHQGAGNILIGDGSVQALLQIGFTAPPGNGFATNRIVVP